MPGPVTSTNSNFDLHALVDAQRQINARPGRTEQTDPIIAECYAGLECKDPLYEAKNESVFGTPAEKHIQEQLAKLVDKLKFLLRMNETASTPWNMSRLTIFVDKLVQHGKMDGVSDEEAHYFYGAAFKGLLERYVAEIARAAPEDRRQTETRLESLCILLGNPTLMFRKVVVQAVTSEFIQEYTRYIERM